MHARRPLVAVAVFLASGIMLGHWSGIAFLWVCTGLGASLTLAGVCFRYRKISSAFILLCFFFLGAVMVRHSRLSAQNDIAHVARYYRSKPVTLQGVIASDVEEKNFFAGKKYSFVMKVEQLEAQRGWRKKTGIILVNMFRDSGLAYGDRISIEGKLHEPFEFSSDSTFSYKEYLARRGIRLILSVKKTTPVTVIGRSAGNPLTAAALGTRVRLKALLAQYLTANEAGVMQAILLGDRSGIPRHISALFIETGTAHILAISGLHVGIVAFLVFVVFKLLPVNRKIPYALTILFLVFYALVTGARPSVARATIMAGVVIGGFIIERESDMINSLSLAALVILLLNPLTLFDIGFQLSFVSVVAIIVVYPRLLRRLMRFSACRNSRIVAGVLKAMGVSVAAWVGVAGLIAYYFNIVTPITIIANVVVIPCMFVIVALGFCLLLAGCFVPAGGIIIAYCIKAMLSLMAAWVYLLHRVPGSHFYLTHVSSWHVAGYYGILSAALLYPVLMKLTKRSKYATVNPMIKKIFLSCLLLLWCAGSASAFWMWTPETNRWVNPKYDVKDTPGEQLAKALEFYEGEDYPKAIREFEKLIRHYPRAREAAEAQYYISRSFEGQGQPYKAFQEYQRVIEKYPFSERSAEIVERQYDIGNRILESESKRSAFVGMIVGGDYQVIEVFRMVIKNAPYGPLAPQAQYKIGLYLQEKGMHQEARDEFEKVINDYPASEWVKGAQYQIALADASRSFNAPYDQRVTQAAKEGFEEFIEAYPDAQLSEKAKQQIGGLREKEAENAYLIARFYEKQRNYQAARMYYGEVASNFNDTPWAQKAEGRLRMLESRGR